MSAVAKVAARSMWVIALIGAAPALGHTLSITRGTAVVESDALTLELTVSAEDLLHAYNLRPDKNGYFSKEGILLGAAEHGALLLERIVVRDRRGEALPGRLDGMELTPTPPGAIDYDHLRRTFARYKLVYALSSPVHHLSFQQVLGNASRGSPAQIVLAIRSTNRELRTVRLTSGGNVEIVTLTPTHGHPVSAAESNDANRGATCGARPFVLKNAYRTIRALVYTKDDGVRVELFIPTQILETWLPIPRAKRDFFEIEEQTRFLPESRRFMASRNRMYINGVQCEGRVTGAGFLDVGESERDERQPPRRLSAWTSRLHVTMAYDSSDLPDHVDLQWDLFNATVLTANILLLNGKDCVEHDLSTYEPRLTWQRD